MLLDVEVDELERVCLLFNRAVLEQRLSEWLDTLWFSVEVRGAKDVQLYQVFLRNAAETGVYIE